ncbi:MAG: argininosuccinate lyase [Candidatus Micrarchaeota archaeon]
MTKIWEKENTKVKKEVEAYTVGEDYILDMQLLPYDIKASKAHAKMLYSNGYLTKQELGQLLDALKELEKLVLDGKFKIKQEEEDCHTAIENFLIQKLGDAGKKIHTARSRNDQVLTALRLLYIDKLATVMANAKSLQKQISVFAKENKGMQMPGYTHMRKAMPTTVDTLTLAYVAMLDDDITMAKSVLAVLDKNPLGSAAGYGVPLRIDRGITTKELGFETVQENPIHCGNSRGKYESMVVYCLFGFMQTLNKIASDIILFSTSEFGFFKLPHDVCTGSSIMPQKANPDVLELIRGNSHVLHGNLVTINGICLNLMSGFHRDYQLTKGPALNSIKITNDSIGMMTLVFAGLKTDKKRLEDAMTPELYATEKAYKLVEQGIPFRDAYKKIAKEIDQN